jgi:hypothetical protein
MICSACGKDNADGNWVCGGCGEPLVQPAQPSQYNDSELPQSTPTPVQTGSGGGAKIIIVLAVIGALAAASIWFFFFRGPDVSTPKGTMEAYINALAGGDCEKVYDLTPNDMVPENRDQAVNACSQFNEVMNIDYTDYKTIEETIDVDTASVKFQVTISAADQSLPIEMTMQLVKEGGKWKVEPQPI